MLRAVVPPTGVESNSIQHSIHGIEMTGGICEVFTAGKLRVGSNRALSLTLKVIFSCDQGFQTRAHWRIRAQRHSGFDDTVCLL